MTNRVPITKTYKLFIGGKFPRTESGRTTVVHDNAADVRAHVCCASRKDLRDAVEAAGKAQAGWSGATPYLRGQVLYRLAEMIEGKRAELIRAINEPRVAASGPATKSAEQEVDAAIDRVIAFAGWTDKYQQLMGCANPVAGPYHNFTIPEPTGIVGVLCPDELPLLGLISLAVPAIAVGCAGVVLASETDPIPSMVLAEAIATSDLPGGVLNILTGLRTELAPHFASHRGIDAIHAGGVTDEQRTVLRAGSAENMKRVVVRTTAGDAWFDDECEGPGWLEPFVEFKTLWHPSAM